LDFIAKGGKTQGARKAPIVENNAVKPWMLVRSPAVAGFGKPNQVAWPKTTKCEFAHEAG